MFFQKRIKLVMCIPTILAGAETSVTASSTLRGNPEAVLDGEPTSWSAEGGKQLLTLELQYQVPIRSVGSSCSIPLPAPCNIRVAYRCYRCVYPF
jgi:hypothetical protein